MPLDNNKTKLAERISQYDFFASFFLRLPDAEIVQSVFKLAEIDLDNTEESTSLMSKYAKECREKSKEDVLLELSVDRTWLVRGTTKEGPRPPYESLYAGGDDKGSAEACLSSLSAMYHSVGVEISPESNERIDYLGVELSFMSKLCTNQSNALLIGNAQNTSSPEEVAKKFFRGHIHTFATQVADEMIKFARTDFYRGQAMLLKDFILSEQKHYQKESAVV